MANNMNKSQKSKAYRLFMDSQKKILARKYPFLSAKQLQNKANEQWNILCKSNEGMKFKRSEKPNKHHTVNSFREVIKKPTRLREKALSPQKTTSDYAVAFPPVDKQSQERKWNLLNPWSNWNVNMWTSGMATRRGYGGGHCQLQKKAVHRKVPQIIEDEPWTNHHGILTNNKAEDEKKKIKCSVSFFDMAVTHHYPAMSPETPSSHKVFTFSAEERARIQKVLKRSQEQDEPVSKVATPASTTPDSVISSAASTSSEDDDEVKDSVLLRYNHRDIRGSPGSDKWDSHEQQDNVVNNVAESSQLHAPCTPQVDISMSPRVMLAGLTPSASMLPKSNSPASSSSGSCISSESYVITNSETLSQESISGVSPAIDPVKKSPTKRKSPNSDIDKMATDPKSQKKSLASPAIRKVEFSEENIPKEKVSFPPQSSCESKKVHSTEVSKLYETMFGFLSESSQGTSSVSNQSQTSESENDNVQKPPQRSSPRKSPQHEATKSGSMNLSSNLSANLINLNNTPTRLTPKSCLSRTPFRTLVFDSLQDSLQSGVVGKPPTMPSSAKRNTSRIKNGGIAKPSIKEGSSSTLTPSVSPPGLTPSRSSRRLLTRTRRISLDEATENIDNYSDLNAASEFSSHSLHGSNIQQQISSSKPKSLSRSNGLTSLTSMQSENKSSAKPECPPSPTLGSVRRSSPRRFVLSSPRMPVRSSPRKSTSVPVLTDIKDALNNNKVWPSSSESSVKSDKKENISVYAVDDAVQKMRSVVYHHEPQKGLSDFLAGTRMPSECSQFSDASSIASGDSDFDTQIRDNKPSTNMINLIDDIGRSTDLRKNISVRKPRSPTRNNNPGKNNRRSISWSAPREHLSARRRNQSPARVNSPRRAPEIPLTPKLIVTEDDEVVQVNGTNAKAISKKQREDFLCNLFVDLTPPSKQPIRRRVLKSCGESTKTQVFEQFLKGTGDADIFF